MVPLLFEAPHRRGAERGWEAPAPGKRGSCRGRKDSLEEGTHVYWISSESIWQEALWTAASSLTPLINDYSSLGVAKQSSVMCWQEGEGNGLEETQNLPGSLSSDPESVSPLSQCWYEGFPRVLSVQQLKPSLKSNFLRLIKMIKMWVSLEKLESTKVMKENMQVEAGHCILFSQDIDTN